MFFGLEGERKAVELGVKEKMNILLIGETGTGKTYLVKELAKESNTRVNRINLNGETGAADLVGRWTLQNGNTVWSDGVLTSSMRNGDWLVMDEINAALPEVLFLLNALLEEERKITLVEKDGEVVEAHDNFRFFATMNPVTEYVGTKEMNKALMSRFHIVLNFEGYDPTTERSIIRHHSGLSEEDASMIVDIGNEIRKLKNAKQIYYTCSLRDLIYWAKVYAQKAHNLGDSFMVSIINKVDFEDRTKVLTVLNKFSAIPYAASKKAGDVKCVLSKELMDMESTALAKIDKLELDIKAKERSLHNLTKKVSDLATGTGFRKAVESWRLENNE